MSTDASQPAAEGTTRHILAVRGLDCPDEAGVVNAAVRPLPGVREVTFDYTAGTACVTCAVGGATADQLAAAITAAGLPTSPASGGSAPVAEAPDQAIRWLAGGAMLAIAAGFAWSVIEAGGVRAALAPENASLGGRACYALALALSWIRLLPRTWGAIRTKRADMHVLMAIAVIGALSLGEWLEAATVSALFLISLALEQWSVGRARDAIGALLSLAPAQARIRDAQGERLVPAESVTKDAEIVVQPGERVPVDGTVVSGTSHIDQAPITGESLPVAKNSGDRVFAGTVNAEGLLVIRAAGGATDSALARMTKLVAEARSQRGSAERWVDRFARFYTPAVVVAACLMAMLPPLLGGGPWGTWLYNALVLLVIACPCALVIATPVATVAALARAARNGVLVKGGEHLEQAARLRSLAVDKTGTLTTGRPSVSAIIAAPGFDERAVLSLAATLEARSDHPLARAIVADASRRGLTPPLVDAPSVIPGKGMTGTVHGRATWLGSPRFADERAPGGWRPETAVVGSMVIVGTDGQAIGAVVVADTVRPEAHAALQACRELGIDHIVMVTGDDARVAKAVGDRLGIDVIHAGLMPDDKVRLVGELAERMPPVALVGDGVNDAPALARAHLGVAMGAAATPAALETADVALLGDDLRRLPWLIEHARHARSIVIQNISAALFGKAVFLALSLAGHASLWVAIAADTGISLLVTINALRLLSSSEPKA